MVTFEIADGSKRRAGIEPSLYGLSLGSNPADSRILASIPAQRREKDPSLPIGGPSVGALEQ